MALLAACGEPETALNPSPSPTTPTTAIEVGSDAWGRLATVERAARIQALQASAGPEFAVRESRAGVLSAVQRGMGLRADFQSGRASVVAASGDDTAPKPIELAATAWGCAGSMVEVPGTEPAVGDVASTVSFRHTGFVSGTHSGPRASNKGSRSTSCRSAPSAAKR